MTDLIGYDNLAEDPTVFTDAVDTDGNGIDDTSVVVADRNYDGSPDLIIRAIDVNQDGFHDLVTTFEDSDGDGLFDILRKQMDLDGDGILETEKTYVDCNGDGTEDASQTTVIADTDGDGIPDASETHIDFNGDGTEDASQISVSADTDGDGWIDSLLTFSDLDGNGTVDMAYATVYNPETGEISYVDLFDGESEYLASATLSVYNPENSDPSKVSGSPEVSMEHWEFQGATNRCALFSQLFVIEELTGEELKIEDVVKLAEENGWFDESSGTPLLNMDKVLHYYGVDNTMSFNNDIEDIKECLDKGGKIIVSLDADEIWFGDNHNIFDPSDGANHAVEVIGIDYTDPDNPMVILNDSGTPNGCGEMVPLAQFEDAWSDGDGQMIECYA